MNHQKDQLICSICYCRIQFQGIISSCNHQYCVKCILQWAKIQNKCPICKRTFKQIRQIYKTNNPFKPKLIDSYYKVMNKSQSSPIIRPPIMISRPIDKTVDIYFEDQVQGHEQ